MDMQIKFHAGSNEDLTGFNGCFDHVNPIPRLHGEASGTRLRVILRTVRNMFSYWIRRIIDHHSAVFSTEGR